MRAVLHIQHAGMLKSQNAHYFTWRYIPSHEQQDGKDRTARRAKRGNRVRVIVGKELQDHLSYHDTVKTERTIDVIERKRKYITAYCHLMNATRTFKRSRIREIVAAYSSLGIQESLPPFSLPSLSFQEWGKYVSRNAFPVDERLIIVAPNSIISLLDDLNWDFRVGHKTSNTSLQLLCRLFPKQSN